MIIKRPFWEALIEEAWSERSIIWLMGLRRVGKTSLCKSLGDIEYFDCERPRFRQLFVDPEVFLEMHRGRRIVLDEIHRLDNPSEVLKIAADHYPDIKIIATGSSTLGASAKFKDTLTGRKREVYLTPLFLDEMELFGATDLAHRFLFGGFPSFFAQQRLPENDFSEWMDAYWAKDIADLFAVGKRTSFLKFAELLLAQSGGVFEATRFTTPCEVTRATIAHYLDVLEETFVVSVVRPYSSYKPTEIVSAPKVYGMDTGFIAFVKGWRELRVEDYGVMWEYCVLNELQGRLQTRKINYWRDKGGHEVDFVVKGRGNELSAIECKFTSFLEDTALTKIGRNFEAFRKGYPDGENFVVASNIDVSFVKDYKGLRIRFVGVAELVEMLRRK